MYQVSHYTNILRKNIYVYSFRECSKSVKIYLKIFNNSKLMLKKWVKKVKRWNIMKYNCFTMKNFGKVPSFNIHWHNLHPYSGIKWEYTNLKWQWKYVIRKTNVYCFFHILVVSTQFLTCMRIQIIANIYMIMKKCVLLKDVWFFF